MRNVITTVPLRMSLPPPFPHRQFSRHPVALPLPLPTNGSYVQKGGRTNEEQCATGKPGDRQAPTRGKGRNWEPPPSLLTSGAVQIPGQ